MKELLKKLIGVITCLTLVASLAACNKKHENESDDKVSELEKEVIQLRKENETLKGQAEDVGSSIELKSTSIPIEIIQQEATKTEYGFSFADFTVKNISGEDINTLTLNIKVLDENKTVINTTHPQEGVVIADGESIVFEAMAEAGAYSMKLDGYSYYTGTDTNGEFVQGHFSDTVEVLLK